jgi:Anti-sigma-K factor rskA/Putative zinc-finger
MTSHASMTCDEFLDLAAAVALDAADPDDVRRVELHAKECPDCGAHLDEFRETAAVLALGVPQLEPPPSLGARVLQVARREPRPLLRRLMPRARSRPSVSPAWLVAAASLVVSVGALAWVAALQGQVSDLQRNAIAASERAARYERVVQVLASDKLAIRALQPVTQDVQSRGMAYLDPSTGTGMLMCHNLPPVEQGHAYQVWFVRGNERVSGGMLWPDRSGNGYTMIKVPTDLQSFDSIGLTDEPGGGSAWPTSPRVIGTPLKESTQ